ncbi:MAG: GerMN domain-containing protein [Proteobacteria bacterium]|nr:GerMN domain-containing protein [Pseudomonadota bacterium]
MKTRFFQTAAALLLLLAMPGAGLCPLDARAQEGEGAAVLVSAHLYFADPATGFLKPEARHVSTAGGPAGFARELVAALAAGPAGVGARTLPRGAQVLALFLAPDGTAWVDLSVDALGPSAGVWAEALAVYSVVTTLCMNVPEVKRVRILVAGAEKPAAGHLSLDRAYTENLRFIR